MPPPPPQDLKKHKSVGRISTQKSVKKLFTTNKPELGISQRQISAYRNTAAPQSRKKIVHELPHAPEDSMIKCVDLDTYIQKESRRSLLKLENNSKSETYMISRNFFSRSNNTSKQQYQHNSIANSPTELDAKFDEQIV